MKACARLPQAPGGLGRREAKGSAKLGVFNVRRPPMWWHIRVEEEVKQGSLSDKK